MPDRPQSITAGSEDVLTRAEPGSGDRLAAT
jgi:hypothetical protein